MNQNSNNVAYLQSALRSLEDRYKKLQLRTESLQSENERLVASRTELMVEVERLQDQHIRLRERNLRLTQEFHSKQQECSLLAEKLTMFARGRVSGNSNTGSGSSSFKSGLTQVQEDTEGSSDSLVTVALHGGMVSHPHTALTVSNRTWSEPNLSVIQRELEMVRKGLWSPTTVENQGSTSEEVLSKIMPGFKKSQSELEQQFSRMIEDQPHLLLDGAEEKRLAGIPPGSHTVFNNEVDSVTYVHHCTRSAVALHDKLTNQNQVLRKLQQLLKMPRVSNEPAAASVVTQTSFNMLQHLPDSINSSVWNGMQTDRVCPLCENVFSTVISQEEFEDHVMEHFTGDDLILPDFEILTP